MQQQMAYTWRSMPMHAFVHFMANNMMNCIEMNIKQVKLIA